MYGSAPTSSASQKTIKMFDTDVFNEKWNGSFACVLFVSMSVPLSQWKNDGVKNRSPEITWKLVSHLTHVTCDAIIFRFL